MLKIGGSEVLRIKPRTSILLVKFYKCSWPKQTHKEGYLGCKRGLHETHMDLNVEDVSKIMTLGNEAGYKGEALEE